MKIPESLLIGGILMILLGLARGAGGVILLLHGGETLENIIASPEAVRMVAVGLITIGVLEVISAIGVFLRKRRMWILGFVVTVAFVIDGAINGYILFGRPGDQGTLVNSIIALLIIVCLMMGRRAFIKPD